MAGWRAGRCVPMGAGRREHQKVSDVQRTHREGRRVRPDDVQKMQTCVLLVLPRLLRRKNLRKSSPKENSYVLVRTTFCCGITTPASAKGNWDTRELLSFVTGHRYFRGEYWVLEYNRRSSKLPGDCHFCRFWNTPADRIASSSGRSSMHHLLQVQVIRYTESFSV